MQALVLGGTRFVGAAIVDELRSRGSAITLFTRGTSNPDWYPELDHVHGDRATELDRLGSRTFDAVFDSSGYTVDQVIPAAQLAADMRARYVFISTASVYAVAGHDGVVDEQHPLVDCDDTRDPGVVYGANKVACERLLQDRLGDHLVILRPGLIVGPRDYTDRYNYWIQRLGRGGRVLCPGDGRDPAQLIDARDLARFAVDLAAGTDARVFNVAGPEAPHTTRDLIASATPPGHSFEPTWADAGFLAEHDVEPWQDMPCWLPRDHLSAAILRLDCRAAYAAGLRARPWAETAADTREWLASQPPRSDMTAGLSADRERDLLALLAG